jgi:hypothetical protein
MISDPAAFFLICTSLKLQKEIAPSRIKNKSRLPKVVRLERSTKRCVELNNLQTTSLTIKDVESVVRVKVVFP